MEKKKKYGGKITSPHTMQQRAIHNMVRYRYDAPLYDDEQSHRTP